MKVFLLFTFFVPIAALGQDIPKFSNTILARGVSFNQAKDSLLSQGYFIDQQNEQDGTIITKPKGVEKNDVRTIIIEVYVKDSIARITGRWNNNYNYRAQSGGLFSVDKTQFTPVEYWRSGISVPHKMFLIMDSYAKSMTSLISYEKL